MKVNPAIDSYFGFRNELDTIVSELYTLHAEHLNCRKGCDMCCEDFGVLPVEYEAMKHQAGDLLALGQQPEKDGRCPYLVNHSCAIYEARPVMCRTQGLPLLYMGEENWELSACELNFTEFDFDEFSEENTFPLDRFNSRLYLINQQFLQADSSGRYRDDELIPLSEIWEKATGKTE